MSRYIFHIGLHKTATTYLQYIYFPNKLNVRFLHLRFDKGGSMYDILKKNIDLSGENLFSSERLSGQKWKKDRINDRSKAHSWISEFEKSIFILKEVFPDAEIILFIRKQGDLLHSMYKQYLQEGGVLPFKKFYGDKGVIRKSDLSLEKRIRLIEKNFSTYHILSFEEFKKYGDAYLNNFFTSIGLRLNTRFKNQYIPNESISGKKVEILRNANKIYQFLPASIKEYLAIRKLTPRHILQNRLNFWKTSDRKSILALKAEMNESFKSDWKFASNYLYKNSLKIEIESLIEEPAILRKKDMPFWRAELYGMGVEFRRFGYYPLAWPINVYSAHGISMNDVPAPHELNTKAPVMLYFTKAKANKYRELSPKLCYPIIAPFVYHRRRKRLKQNADAKGTLVFAAHSTHVIDDLSDINNYISELNELPSIYKPLTICLHYVDVEKGLHEKFIKAGFKVATAGHSLHQDFIPRFYKLLSQYKYVTSNIIGSYTFYAVEMGIPFFLYGTGPEFHNRSDENIEKGHYNSYNEQENRKKAVQLFSGIVDSVTLEQKEFVEAHLGIKDSISRIKLAALLYWSLFYLIRNRIYHLFFKKVIRMIIPNF